MAKVRELKTRHKFAAAPASIHNHLNRSRHFNRHDDFKQNRSAAMVVAARSRPNARKFERVDESGERGDRKAVTRHLERAPETRAEFGVSNEHDVVGITVIPEVPDPKLSEMPVIEAIPVSARWSGEDITDEVVFDATSKKRGSPRRGFVGQGGGGG